MTQCRSCSACMCSDCYLCGDVDLLEWLLRVVLANAGPLQLGVVCGSGVTAPCCVYHTERQCAQAEAAWRTALR